MTDPIVINKGINPDSFVGPPKRRIHDKVSDKITLSSETKVSSELSDVSKEDEVDKKCLADKIKQNYLHLKDKKTAYKSEKKADQVEIRYYKLRRKTCSNEREGSVSKTSSGKSRMELLTDSTMAEITSRPVLLRKRRKSCPLPKNSVMSGFDEVVAESPENEKKIEGIECTSVDNVKHVDSSHDNSSPIIPSVIPDFSEGGISPNSNNSISFSLSQSSQESLSELQDCNNLAPIENDYEPNGDFATAPATDYEPNGVFATAPATSCNDLKTSDSEEDKRPETVFLHHISTSTGKDAAECCSESIPEILDKVDDNSTKIAVIDTLPSYKSASEPSALDTSITLNRSKSQELDIVIAEGSHDVISKTALHKQDRSFDHDIVTLKRAMPKRRKEINRVIEAEIKTKRKFFDLPKSIPHLPLDDLEELEVNKVNVNKDMSPIEQYLACAQIDPIIEKEKSEPAGAIKAISVKRKRKAALSALTDYFDTTTDDVNNLPDKIIINVSTVPEEPSVQSKIVKLSAVSDDFESNSDDSNESSESRLVEQTKQQELCSLDEQIDAKSDENQSSEKLLLKRKRKEALSALNDGPLHIQKSYKAKSGALSHENHDLTYHGRRLLCTSCNISLCPVCNLSMGSASIKRHFTDSRGKNGFLCNICRIKFPTSCAHKAHEQLHSGITPFVCPSCGSTYRSRKYFIEHSLGKCTHLFLTTQHMCLLCCNTDKNALFYGLNELIKHQKLTHITTRFHCKFCETVLGTDEQEARDHSKIEHEAGEHWSMFQCGLEKITFCEYCQKQVSVNHADRAHKSAGRRTVYQCPCARVFHGIVAFRNHRSACEQTAKIPPIWNFLYKEPDQFNYTEPTDCATCFETFQKEPTDIRDKCHKCAPLKITSKNCEGCKEEYTGFGEDLYCVDCKTVRFAEYSVAREETFGLTDNDLDTCDIIYENQPPDHNYSKLHDSVTRAIPEWKNQSKQFSAPFFKPADDDLVPNDAALLPLQSLPKSNFGSIGKCCVCDIDIADTGADPLSSAITHFLMFHNKAIIPCKIPSPYVDRPADSITVKPENNLTKVIDNKNYSLFSKIANASHPMKRDISEPAMNRNDKNSAVNSIREKGNVSCEENENADVTPFCNDGSGDDNGIVSPTHVHNQEKDTLTSEGATSSENVIVPETQQPEGPSGINDGNVDIAKSTANHENYHVCPESVTIPDSVHTTIQEKKENLSDCMGTPKHVAKKDENEDICEEKASKVTSEENKKLYPKSVTISGNRKIEHTKTNSKSDKLTSREATGGKKAVDLEVKDMGELTQAIKHTTKHSFDISNEKSPPKEHEFWDKINVALSSAERLKTGTEFLPNVTNKRAVKRPKRYDSDDSEEDTPGSSNKYKHNESSSKNQIRDYINVSPESSKGKPSPPQESSDNNAQLKLSAKSTASNLPSLNSKPSSSSHKTKDTMHRVNLSPKQNIEEQQLGHEQAAKKNSTESKYEKDIKKFEALLQGDKEMVFIAKTFKSKISQTSHKRKLKPSSKLQYNQLITQYKPQSLSVPQKQTCCICKVKYETREEFVAHIRTHRTDEGTFQCMDCGECFVVRSTLEKHLYFYHKIVDAETYIMENACSDKISGNVKSDVPLKDNQCKVCRLVLESPKDLNKHFRLHGAAFLKEAKSARI